MPNDKTTQEILDETERKMLNNLYGKKAKMRGMLRRFRTARKFLVVIIIVFLALVIIRISYLVVISPPRYSDAETAQSAVNLERLIDAQAGMFAPRFHSALALLKKYPEYYRKVVNNIHDIRVKSGICPYGCIYYRGYVTTGGTTDYFKNLILPETNLNEKTLIINPNSASVYSSEVEFASMLVHETDHVQYLESSRLRRLGLFIKCNPILNLDISVYSNIASLSHRFKVIEICAEKEELAFSQVAKTTSRYRTNGNLFTLVSAPISDFFNTASNLFKAVISNFR